MQVPAILYFERVDMRNKLNYSELPHELDLSILNRDINIATYCRYLFLLPGR